MEPNFWRERWAEGRTAFHEGKPNGFLVTHLDRLAGCQRVLVPLCGKSEDLAFLAARGHEVVGVELVEDAVRQFFATHAATPGIEREGGFTIYAHGALEILAGDFFAMTRELAGEIDAIYDRAALVALPAEMRPRYVAKLRELAPSARMLLVSLEHPNGDGPPFSVEPGEVHALFEGAQITELGNGPDPRGRPGLHERCYAIAWTA